MKKLLLYLILSALAFWFLARQSSMKDATDFVLIGIAALLLALVVFVLLMVILNIYRFIRYRHGSQIKEDGFLYHGPLNSRLVPWDRIDALKIEMNSNIHLHKSGRVRRSKMKFPDFSIHRIDKNQDTPVIMDDMPKAIAKIQEHVRSKSPVYTQHDIDWVERWHIADRTDDDNEPPSSKGKRKRSVEPR